MALIIADKPLLFAIILLEMSLFFSHTKRLAICLKIILGFALVSLIFFTGGFSTVFAGVSVPAIPISAAVITPYGGQVMFTVPCPCSGGNLYVIHDYRSKLVLPIYQSFATTIYHTRQNIGSLFTPGHFQLGNLLGTNACVLGVPPLCLLPIPALNIKNFGNGGLPLGGFAVGPLAYGALATTLAIAGASIIYPSDVPAIDPDNPDTCYAASFESASFSGSGDNVTLHVSTPGRENWPMVPNPDAEEPVTGCTITGMNIPFDQDFTFVVSGQLSTDMSADSGVATRLWFANDRDKYTMFELFYHGSLNMRLANRMIHFSRAILGSIARPNSDTDHWAKAAGAAFSAGIHKFRIEYSYANKNVKLYEDDKKIGDWDFEMNTLPPPITSLTFILLSPQFLGYKVGTANATEAELEGPLGAAASACILTNLSEGDDQYVNAEILIDGQHAGWMVEGANEAVLKFEEGADRPNSGDEVDIELRSVDAACSISESAEWP